jgi:hypothetical protein
MIKSRWVLVVLAVLGPISLGVMYAQQATLPPAVATEDELAVYAAVLDSPTLGSTSRPLIADTTSTFATAYELLMKHPQNG